MGTIVNLIQRAGSVFRELPTWRANSFEHSVSYYRIDGKIVEMAITHLPDVSGEGRRAPTLQLATRKTQRSNSLNEFICLSMEEARLLRDLLNREEVAEWLEEEA